jgi:hypothetical protein
MPATTSPPLSSEPTPMPLVVPIPLWMLAAVQSKLPAVATATVVYRDGNDRLVGIALADMGNGTFTVSAGTSAARLISALLPEQGG